MDDINQRQVLSNRARGPPRSFNFDHVFWTGSSQYEVYQSMGEPLVDSLLAGFNVCLFGYGQTGSGKTYTMMGSDGENNRGIIPRFYSDLLHRLQKMKESGTIEALNCEVSYFEVYNERIYDLLRKSENQKESPKERVANY